MKTKLFLLVVVFALLASAGCSTMPFGVKNPQLGPRATPTEVVARTGGNVKVFYSTVDWPSWMGIIPQFRVYKINFTDKGWEALTLGEMDFYEVELLKAVAKTQTDYDTNVNIGGCTWHHTGMYGLLPDENCVSLTPEATILANLTLEYCVPFEQGTLCKKDVDVNKLRVYIEGEGESISFTAENNFLPEFRIWVQEVLKYFDYQQNLGPALQPGINYKVYKGGL